MEYLLRKFTNEDYEFVYGLKKEVYEGYVIENWGKWDEPEQRKYFENFVELVKQDMYIIIYENQEIGFLNYEILESGEFELGNICILPKFQGKGIGTKILTDLLKSNEDKNVYLQYFKQNRVGALYERPGFEKIAETKIHIKMVKRKK